MAMPEAEGARSGGSGWWHCTDTEGGMWDSQGKAGWSDASLQSGIRGQVRESGGVL